MQDGMHTDTMVNMNWKQIKDYADKKALVLLPLGVIEEHGPHLCLGTDIYTAHIQSLFIKKRLEEKGHIVVIGPPFYWGVCQATGGFMGSFRIKKETARALLFDILTSLFEFGFRDIYGITGHNDIEHNIAVLDAFKKASDSYEINCRYAFNWDVMHHYGLKGDEPFICPVKSQIVKINTSEYQDVHAGDIETATMNHFYAHLTDTDTAKSLAPIQFDQETIIKWIFGGLTEDLSSEGYLGAPADYKTVNVLDHFNDLAQRISTAIHGTLGSE